MPSVGAASVRYISSPASHLPCRSARLTLSCIHSIRAHTVEFEYHGDPIDAKHCHCTQCQRLHGAPFQWAALFHKTSVRLAKHCDPLHLDFFSTQEGHSEHSVPCKISCRNCRSPMA